MHDQLHCGFGDSSHETREKWYRYRDLEAKYQEGRAPGLSPKEADDAYQDYVDSFRADQA